MRTSIFLHSYWILRLPHILILPIWWVKIELSFCNFYFPSFQHAWNSFFSTYLLFIYTINISPYMNLFSYYFLDLFIFLQCIWSLVSRNINSFSIYIYICVFPNYEFIYSRDNFSFQENSHILCINSVNPKELFPNIPTIGQWW